MKSFVYMYPIPEFINQEIEWNHNFMGPDNEKEERNAFRKAYKTVLNECIDKRYRINGFQINWAIFDSHPVSDIAEICKEDRIIEAGIDFKTHTIKKIYADNDYLINALEEKGKIENLIVAGFHAFSCVERLAKRAYERGIKTMIDEDLTEFLKWNMFDKGFRVDRYPNYSKERFESMGDLKKHFFDARKEPYFWQDYSKII